MIYKKVALSLFLFLFIGCSHRCYTKDNLYRELPPNPTLSGPLTVIKINNSEGVILPKSHIPALLFQCSRSTLGPGTDYWVPTTEDINKVEKRLNDFIYENMGNDLKDLMKYASIDLAVYKRQYAGIIRQEVKTIYVNLVYAEKEPLKTMWRNQAALACDGWIGHIGVEFDIDAGKFIHFAHNN